MPQVRAGAQCRRQRAPAEGQKFRNCGVNEAECLTARAACDGDYQEHAGGDKTTGQEPDTGLLAFHHLSFIEHRHSKFQSQAIRPYHPAPTPSLPATPYYASEQVDDHHGPFIARAWLRARSEPEIQAPPV